MERSILYSGPEIQDLPDYQEEEQLELLVEFDYQPEEPPERGPEAQYPGCSEEFSAWKVSYNGEEITDLFSDFTAINECLSDQRPYYS